MPSNRLPPQETDLVRPGHLMIACFVLAVSALPVAAQTGSVETRLRALEDKEQIAQVLLDYGRHLDSRDLKAYASLFASDGEWVGGFGTVKGRDNIQAFMEKNMGGPNRNNSYHLMSNFVITAKGDTATAWSRWTFVTPTADGKPVISQAGRYDDILVRENGRWRFKRRVASNDIPAPK